MLELRRYLLLFSSVCLTVPYFLVLPMVLHNLTVVSCIFIFIFLDNYLFHYYDQLLYELLYEYYIDLEGYCRFSILFCLSLFLLYLEWLFVLLRSQFHRLMDFRSSYFIFIFYLLDK